MKSRRQTRSGSDGAANRSYYEQVSDIIEELRPGLPPTGRPPSAGKRKTIQRAAKLALLSVCIVAAVTYAGDYALARHRLAHGAALGSVRVVTLYAIPQKSGKTEFAEGATEMRTCVRSLFPHFGHAPCWYASRHREQRTNF